MLTRRGLTSSLLACGGASAFPTGGGAQDMQIQARTTGPAKTVKLPGAAAMPVLGLGSWHLGQGRHPLDEEEAALRSGLSLGMTMIDTAEVYGGGRAEELCGRLMGSDLRDKTFLVSKVLPNHATKEGIPAACEASLKRLRTDHLDLLLLHWRTPAVDLAEVVPAFEALRNSGHIRAWGVSNFGTRDMVDLFRVKGGDKCAANQILYNLSERGSEADVQPWCNTHGIPVMAYTPLGGRETLANPSLKRIADAHGCTPAAVALAWTIRNGNTVAIPESGSAAHVKENAVALFLQLTAKEVSDLDGAFPA